MENCVFCKIVEEKIPSVKIWEDEKFMAFLDVMPNTKGMTLVIPKEHMESYLFDKSDEVICDIVVAGKTVANVLEKGLGVKRVALVMEGLGVNHLHLKLYPIYEDSEEYEGHLTTELGPKMSMEELEEVKEEILG